MKRGKLSILAFLILVVPFVSASITIQGPAQEKYNNGDTVHISGYLIEANAIKGFISTTVVCDSSEFPLQLVPIDIEANKKMSFPEEIVLPPITISASMSGSCKIKIAVTDGQNEFSSASSKQFSVIKSLDGKFSIDDSKIQVGSQLTLSGKITKMDGSLASGIAEVYFSHNGTKYLIELVHVDNGKISYTYKASATPQGNYQIDVLMRDTYGNEMMFDNVANFQLINRLSVMARTDKTEYLPGNTITVTGSAKNAHMNNVMDAEVEVSLDFKNYQAKVKDGAFKYEMIIPTDLKTGKHTVSVLVKDSIGNNGGEQITINVLAIPTKLENELSALGAYPLEEIVVTPTLLDQAGDKLDETVLIEILDPKRDLRVSKAIDSNRKASFKVPEFAAPGEWEIKASMGKLKDDGMFTVKEKEDVTAELQANKLYLHNKGNIKFKDAVEIQFEGEESYKARVRKSIMPNETATIDIGEYAPDGNYDVTVLVPNMAPLTFKSVSVTEGKPIKMFNWLYIVLIAGFAFFLLFFTLSRPSRPKQNIPKSKKRKLAVINRASEDVHVMEEEKRRNLKDFKDRVLGEIEKTEKNTFRSKRGGMFGGDSSSGEANGGFANMFG